MEGVDWSGVHALTDAEIEAGRRADPDAVPPMTDEEIGFAKGAGVRVIRQRLALSQVMFSRTFRIPLGTLRDWEQGVSTPDATARTYLLVIQNDPKAVREALNGRDEAVEA
ncbi:helix-turn-helix domain-containing protein [Roseomonas elaeocarpi]|uniref:Helix-turn-helix domain-containing protein n=1 Tax=Roseomonas elaeocarpi TaxID=907779 RepID=A0ABV6JQK4_9PROT